jgi:ketosteroid isomerase-like protein
MTTNIETSNEQRLRDQAIAWVRAVENGASGDELASFVTPDVVHEDMPNRFFPNGMRYDLAGMQAGAERGKAIMRRQRYDILSVLASGHSVAMQLDWTAEVAIPLGTLAPGDEMRAHIAIFLEFRDGKICRQRDYGCYEPF